MRSQGGYGVWMKKDEGTLIYQDGQRDEEAMMICITWIWPAVLARNLQEFLCTTTSEALVSDHIRG